DRVQFVFLPEYGSVASFLRAYRPAARLLRRCIDASKYIQCAIGGGNEGLAHDWAAGAAEQAVRAGREVGLLTDAVSFDSILQRAGAVPPGLGNLPRRLKLRLKAALVRAWQLRLVRRCDLLFANGMITYLALAPHVKSPEVARKINDFQIGS